MSPVLYGWPTWTLTIYLEKKAKCKLLTDASCFLNKSWKQLSTKKLSVRPLTFHLRNHSSKTNQTYWTLIEKWVLTHEWGSPVDPHLGSWNCLPHQAHIALSEPMSSTDKQGSSLDSFPTSPPLNPHFNRPSGFWPCVKSCLVGGSDKYLDSSKWTKQYWPTSKTLYTLALCGYWMSLRGPANRNGSEGQMAIESQRNPCYQHDLIIVMIQ